MVSISVSCYHLLNSRSIQGVGVGLALLRRSGAFLTHIARRRMLVTLEIPNKDRAFEWFLTWQAKQDKASSASRFIPSHELSVETAFRQGATGSSEAVFNLVAGPGIHWLKYRGSWMQVCFACSLVLIIAEV